MNENGESYGQATISMPFEVEVGVPFLYKESKRGFQCLGASAEVKFSFGLEFETDLVISGTFGSRVDTCAPEECVFFSTTPEALAAMEFEIEADMCLGGDCEEYDFASMGLQTGVSGTLGKNSREDCNGWFGEACFSGVEFYATISVCPWTLETSCDIADGKCVGMP